MSVRSIETTHWVVALVAVALLGLLFALFGHADSPPLFSARDLVTGVLFGLFSFAILWRYPLRNPRHRLILSVVMACLLVAGGVVSIMG
jgi:type IV secretory pathway TrbL component